MWCIISGTFYAGRSRYVLCRTFNALENSLNISEKHDSSHTRALRLSSGYDKPYLSYYDRNSPTSCLSQAPHYINPALPLALTVQAETAEIEAPGQCNQNPRLELYQDSVGVPTKNVFSNIEIGEFKNTEIF